MKKLTKEDYRKNRIILGSLALAYFALFFIAIYAPAMVLDFSHNDVSGNDDIGSLLHTTK